MYRGKISLYFVRLFVVFLALSFLSLPMALVADEAEGVADINPELGKNLSRQEASFGLEVSEGKFGLFFGGDINFLSNTSWIFGLNIQGGVHGLLAGSVPRAGGAQVIPLFSSLLSLGFGFGYNESIARVWIGLEGINVLTGAEYILAKQSTYSGLYEFGLGLRAKLAYYIDQRRAYGLTLNTGIGILPWRVELVDDSSVPKVGDYYNDVGLKSGRRGGKIRIVYSLGIGFSIRSAKLDL